MKHHIPQARVQGGGRGGPPPSLEIEQQKKFIRANFQFFHLYFATNITFSDIFWAGPPWKIEKQKKKDFRPPPTPRLYEFLDTTLSHARYCFISSNTKCKPICNVFQHNSNVTAFQPPHTVLLRSNIVSKANVVIAKAKCLYIPIIHIYLLFFAHVILFHWGYYRGAKVFDSWWRKYNSDF